MRHDAEHPGSTQIRTYVPDDQYRILCEFTAARHTSLSQTVRDLIDAGIKRDALNEAASHALAAVTTALDHLERLTFYIAQNTAAERIAAEKSGEAAAKRAFPGDPARAAEAVATARGEIQMLAHERIRKVLRRAKPKALAETGEED